MGWEGVEWEGEKQEYSEKQDYSKIILGKQVKVWGKHHCRYTICRTGQHSVPYNYVDQREINSEAAHAEFTAVQKVDYLK